MINISDDTRIKALKEKTENLSKKFNTGAGRVISRLITLSVAAVSALFAVKSAPTASNSDKALLAGAVFAATYVTARVGSRVGAWTGLAGGAVGGGTIGATGGLAIGFVNKTPGTGLLIGGAAGAVVGMLGGAMLGGLGGYGAGVYYGHKLSNEFMQRNFIKTAAPQTTEAAQPVKAVTIDFKPATRTLG